jgi:peptide chain release factor 1
MLNWEEIRTRHDELSQLLSSPDLDNTKRQEYQKEHSYLSTLLAKQAEIQSLEEQIQQTKEQAQENNDPELALLFDTEIQELAAQHQAIVTELEEVLFPPDPMDNRSIFLEIRAGTGGQEAALFASDLARMYTNYALQKGWQVAIVDASETDLKGFREIVLHIQGKKVYGHLKHEAGVHRVQRVPQTETSGRIHTSTATVAIMPEVKEVEFAINPSDLRIDTYRAGGAGGQHVNKTDSAVRITHVPTGVVVACQDERSQHKNKAKAMKVLQSRLFTLQREQHEEEMSKKRKEMVGTGERAEKVRTYNFPQNRVTDHQVEMTLKNLDRFILGDLDEIIEALRKKDREERRKNPVL